jgi:hypothetical protein
MATGKNGIDTDALIAQFEQATDQQAQMLRQTVHKTTLQALQQRALTLKTVKDVVQSVTQAAAAGAARNTQGVDLDALLAQTVAGVDDAVRQAVQASQRALQQLLDQGVELREKQVKKAMDDIEKMEDLVFQSMRKATSGGALSATQGAWAQALMLFGQGDSATGQAANEAVEELMARAQAVSRQGRAFNQRAAQAFMEHYATLVSGVLIGMTEAMAAASGTAQAASAPAPAKEPPARKTR